MSASLTVRYHKTEPVVGETYGHGLLVEVVNSVGMPGKIFVAYRSQPSPTDPEVSGAQTLDEFNHVATVPELYAIPEDVPDPDRFGSAFRTDSWEFSFRSPAELEDSLNLLKQDIGKLVKQFNSDCRVTEYQEETYE